MQLLILPLIGILLFYLDTLVNYFSPVSIFHHDFYMTSYLLFIYLLILTVYKNPNIALILGVILGIVSDVYFGTIYGIYTFGFIIFIFLMNQLFKVFYKDIKMMILLFLIFIILFEHFFYVTFNLLGMLQMNYFEFIGTHVIPTVILNFVLIILVFPVVLRILEKYVK